jgi:ADP-glucose pyrophosphorylase
MPGVRIGRGARIRRAIIEEGVQIPPHFEAGWNIDRDRRSYAVSPSGVVVISETPRVRKRIVACSILVKTTAGLEHAGRGESVRNIA